jgi:hypothetical protein
VAECGDELRIGTHHRVDALSPNTGLNSGWCRGATEQGDEFGAPRRDHRRTDSRYAPAQLCPLPVGQDPAVVQRPAALVVDWRWIRN